VTIIQSPPFSRYSTEYPVISLPPSFSGAVQVKTMLLEVTSTATGTDGGPGGPLATVATEVSGLLSPSSLTARTRKQYLHPFTNVGTV